MDSLDPKDPLTTLATLRDLCVDELGQRAAAWFVGRTWRGFGLTEAGPGQIAGHCQLSGTSSASTQPEQHQPVAWSLMRKYRLG